MLNKPIFFGVVILQSIFVLNCNNNGVNHNACKYQTKDFEINIPCYYTFTNLNSIDSKAGKINFDSFEIIYDFGRFNALNKVRTEEDFILKDRWMGDAIDILPLEGGKEYFTDTIIKKIKIIKRDLTEKIVTFSYNNKIYKYKVAVPDGIMLTHLVEDSTEGMHRFFYTYYDKKEKDKVDFQVIIQKYENNSTSELDFSPSLRLFIERVRLKDSAFVKNILQTAILIQ